MADDFTVWWHGIPALPAAPEDQAYFALRRVWNDHTINATKGPRSFYRWKTEDYLTLALWQTWEIFNNPASFTGFIQSTGAQVGTLSRVRWAYACEELPTIGSWPVIPDIMLAYEDERGEGLVTFEVKKPGKAANVKDADKLHQYCRLPSTHPISRRQGCLLVSEAAALATRRDTWQLSSCDLGAVSKRTGRGRSVHAHRSRGRQSDRSVDSAAFRQAGIGPGQAAPASQSPAYATSRSFDNIRELGLPGALERFLMGSECVEAAYNNETPAAPL